MESNLHDSILGSSETRERRRPAVTRDTVGAAATGNHSTITGHIVDCIEVSHPTTSSSLTNLGLSQDLNLSKSVNTIFCDICSCSFPSFRSRASHRVHCLKKSRLDKDASFCCEICYRSFKSEHGLKIHYSYCRKKFRPVTKISTSKLGKTKCDEQSESSSRDQAPETGSSHTIEHETGRSFSLENQARIPTTTPVDRDSPGNSEQEDQEIASPLHSCHPAPS